MWKYYFNCNGPVVIEAGNINEARAIAGKTMDVTHVNTWAATRPDFAMRPQTGGLTKISFKS